jgi:photosystem II stability/assembly factor-like uncharacterized protein
MRHSLCVAALCGAPLLATYTPVHAQSATDVAQFAALGWRHIGPFRGGRTKAAVGVPQRPGTFYIGVVNGGVWRTTDYGRVWTPIFDDQPTGSVGAIAVAPSNPDILFLGSGEGMQRPDLSVGDGMYVSRDAGATWTHLGLRDAQQITQIVVDPVNPARLFVAALGHPYGPNTERGVYRSLDGGQSFTRVLYRDSLTGAADLAMDPRDPNTLYAVLWQSQHGPWENAVFTGPGSGLHKSTDGGTTWRAIGRGLPSYAGDGLGRIGITVAPSDSRRLYATVEARRGAGLYRSDDAGESWTLVNDDPRTVARPGDAAEVRVPPTNPDIVFVPTIVTWKSIDGGRTFTGIRGAPGGDDYQRLWIDPSRPDVMLLAADQGAVITVNGGATWSSWYNQPTAQFYHVSTDNAFPYRVCGGQQESGSACVQSRGNYGYIDFRNWTPVGVEEYGYVAPDPRDPDIVYGGKVSRWDRRTGQVQNVAPRLFRAADYRTIRTMPVLFSPIDSSLLFFASNQVWSTRDGGATWTARSPDLTRRDSSVARTLGAYADRADARARHPGVIYALAPSPVDSNTLWAGTDDGLMHVTRDGGKSWQNVTPPALRPWDKISQLDASHREAGTVYVAVNSIRLDDLRPHLYRTRDGGKSWTRIVRGIPDGTITNTIREDPVRAGLLFAGTEHQVYVSFTDGDDWHSLRGAMPATSIRDLVIKDDDLVVGTHGRGFWIFDDITPLRQMGARADSATLYAPQRATRVRWTMNTDTPLPPDEPIAPNPPEGALIHYRLPAAAKVVQLEIRDSTGAVVRRYASDDPPAFVDTSANIPRYWIRPELRLGTAAGLHRVAWDLRAATPLGFRQSYPIAAVPANTVLEPRGEWVLPGRYTVRLTVDGVVREQSLIVRMDPRVRTPTATLVVQHELSRSSREWADTLAQRARDARFVRGQADAARPFVTPALADEWTRVLALLDHFAGNRREAALPAVGELSARLQTVFDASEDADRAPTAALRSAHEDARSQVVRLDRAWREELRARLDRVATALRAAGAPLQLPPSLSPR